MSHPGWETVIGLEIHVQLATASKLFSGSSIAFGAEPNTQASLIDVAMPGTLPAPNKEAFHHAILFGLAIGAEINQHSVFERKNYFYPDLPKGYQTTQLAEPIVGAGNIEITLDDGRKKNVRIHHAHLEEDAGKSLHEDFHGMSGIDLNRAGTPLIEIVTEPDIRNAEEAVAFAKKLHSLVTALGICDGEMSQGSMRFDVNISVRPQGEEKLGTRTETKNLNSFKFMEDAIELEVERQITAIENGEKIVQETRLYNGDTKVARSMRSKEDSNDYRYFPCPDLLPVILSDEYIEEIRQEMPELPEAKQARYISDFGFTDIIAAQLASDKATADYFDALVELSNLPKLASNWVLGELAAALNKAELSIANSPVSAERLSGLLKRLDDDTLSSKTAKQAFAALWDSEDDIDAVIDKHGLKPMADTGALEAMVDQVIAENPEQVDNYRNADDTKRKKMIGFFVGQIMKLSQGKANPGLINKLLAQKLND